MGVGQLVAALCPEVLRYAQTSRNTYALVHKCPRDFPGLCVPEGGRTPLLIKSMKGHEAVVRLLLQHGADVAQATNDGWTALMFASREGYEALVQLLLQHGADVAQATNRGMTALRLAVNRGHRAVELLLRSHR